MKQANHIKSLDERFEPFALEMYQLAKQFEDEKIIELVEPLVEHS